MDSSPRKVFLSHAGADTDAALTLAKRLEKNGFQVWIDREKLTNYENWQKQIEDGIEGADVFLLYVTAQGVRNWVDAELRAALVHNRNHPTFQFVAALGPGGEGEKLPLFARSEGSWIELGGKPEDADLSGLIDALLKDGTEKPVRVLEPNESPYLGLRSFTEETAHLFFGREHDVQSLLKSLRRTRFLTVVGASGCGKSSLVRAGLCPALRHGWLERFRGWKEWRIASFRPGDAPFLSAARAIGELRKEGDTTHARADAKLEAFERKSSNEAALLDAVIHQVPTDARVLLVIDQFEELFRGVAPEERRLFLRHLSYAATHQVQPELYVVTTMRSDFLEDYTQSPELSAIDAKYGEKAIWTCMTMEPESLRQAIEMPMLLAGWRIKEDITSRILDELGEEPGGLALLAFALDRLWKRCHGEGEPSETIQEVPDGVYTGLRNPLKEHAEERLEELVGKHGEQAQRILRELIVNLSRGGGTEPVTRRPRLLTELLALFPAEERDLAQTILQDWSGEECRLLVLSQEANATGEVPVDPLVDVAHEAVLRHWETARDWIDEATNRQATREELEKAARTWGSASEDEKKNFRWTGTRVAAALEDAAYDSAPPEVEAFADACRSAEEKQIEEDRLLRQRVTLLGIVPRITRLEAQERDLGAPWPENLDSYHRWLENARPILDARSSLDDAVAAIAAEDEEEAGLRENLEVGAGRVGEFERTVTIVSRRADWAARVLALSIDNHQERWEEAQRAIAASERYRYAGAPLELSPQMGLVPIGENPVTGLWEFYHLRSAADPGSVPAFLEGGRIAVEEETGIVFILVPGGTYQIGAQNTDPAKPHYDQAAESDEAPVHEVPLAPFFLARHQLTQGQWLRLGDGRCNQDGKENPSRYAAGFAVPPAPVTLAHPVENVTWDECDHCLRENGLLLPTECQWEAACRAGTETPWAAGKLPTDLEGFANILDETAKREAPSWVGETFFDDGYVIHAPVGTFRPNAWGFHDMHGNVWEWCRDVSRSYEVQPAGRDGLRGDPSDRSDRVARGGSFYGEARYARSAYRNAIAASLRNLVLGCRPARIITG